MQNENEQMVSQIHITDAPVNIMTTLYTDNTVVKGSTTSLPYIMMKFSFMAITTQGFKFVRYTRSPSAPDD